MAKKATDAKENAEESGVAPQDESAQDEQADTAEEVSTPPETASDKEEEKLYAGKFKSVEDLENSYKELQSSFTRERQAMAQPLKQEPEQGYVPAEVPQLEPDSDAAVRQAIREENERIREADFVRKHADDLKDPLLAGTTQRLIQEANARNEYLDQESALADAKKLLEDRLKTQTKEAQTKGVQEGQELAQKKQQAGAVGDTNKARAKIDPKDMSAAEFAKYHNIPHER